MATRYQKNHIPTGNPQDNPNFGVSFSPVARQRSMITGLETLGPVESTGRGRNSRGASRKKKRRDGRRDSRGTSPVSATLRNSLFTDKESKEIIKDIDLYHNKPTRLKKILYDKGEQLKKMTRARLNLSDETMTYQKLLDDLMLEDETLVLDKGLAYSYMEFKDPAGDVAVRPTMAQGKVFFTSTRLLFVTAEQMKGTILSTYGEPVQGPGGYQVTSYHHDEHHYQCIPLYSIKSVELHTRSGGRAELEVATHKSCSGRCGWMATLCGFGVCLEQFIPSDEGPIGVEYQEKTLIMGVSMPPWNTPTSVLVHISPSVDLTSFTNFVALLQRLCPEIVKMLQPGRSIASPERIRDHIDRLKEKENKKESRAKIETTEYKELDNYAESDMQSVHHGMRKLNQIQLPGSTPAQCDVIYAEDVQTRGQEKVAEQRRVSEPSSILSKNPVDEEIVDTLKRKRTSMIGRQLPEPGENGPITASSSGSVLSRSKESGSMPRSIAPEVPVEVEYSKSSKQKNKEHIYELPGDVRRRIQMLVAEDGELTIEDRDIILEQMDNMPSQERQRVEEELDTLYVERHKVAASKMRDNNEMDYTNHKILSKALKSKGGKGKKGSKVQKADIPMDYHEKVGTWRSEETGHMDPAVVTSGKDRNTEIVASQVNPAFQEEEDYKSIPDGPDDENTEPNAFYKDVQEQSKEQDKGASSTKESEILRRSQFNPGLGLAIKTGVNIKASERQQQDYLDMGDDLDDALSTA